MEQSRRNSDPSFSKYNNTLIFTALHTSTVGTGFIPVLPAAEYLFKINALPSAICKIVTGASLVTTPSDSQCAMNVES